MKYIISFLFFFLVSTIALAQNEQKVESPNVLFIAIDDLNDWISLFDSNNPIQVPNLEKLAAKGALFYHAYCSSPACYPSWASILTGTRPHLTGIYGNSSNWRGALPKTKTLQKYFMDSGYYIGGAGKIFHHHKDWAFHDNGSFNEFMLMTIHEPYPPSKLNGLENYGSRNTDWGRWPMRIEESADFKTMTYAKEFLSLKHKRPFFLNLGFYKPHSPFYAPKEYFEVYCKESLAMPDLKENDWKDVPSGANDLMAKTKWFWRYLMKYNSRNSELYPDLVQAYQSSASFVGEMIGWVLEALEKSEYSENTVIVLWSDHGFHLGKKKHIEKFGLWEKTTHVPLIIVAPGQIKPRTKIETPVDLTTIYPTLAALCGLKKPNVEGISIVPLFRKERFKMHASCFDHLYERIPWA